MSIDGDGNDNILDGTSGDDIINGFAGDDIINGNDGNDTIYGGDDNDWIDGGAGDDIIDAGDGDDYVIYDANDTILALGGAGNDILVYNDGEFEERDVAAQGFEMSAERYMDGTDEVYDVYDLSFNYIEQRRFHNDGTYTLTVYDYENTETWSEWIRVFDATGTVTFEEFIDDDEGGGGNENTAPEDYAPVTEDLVLTVTGNLFTDDLQSNPSGVYVLTEVEGVAVPPTGSVFITGTFGTVQVWANGDYSYILNNSLVQNLAADDIVPDFFAYKFTEDGIDQNTDLIIEITGNNDAPVATNNTAEVQENITLSATGNVLTDDDGFGIDSDIEGQPLGIIDVNGTSLNPVGTTQIAGNFGTLTIDGATGEYTYDLDNEDIAVQALNFGDSLVDSFTYSLTDGSAMVTANLDVTIQGSDAGVQAFGDINSAAEDDVSVATGNVVDNDIGIGISVVNVNTTAVVPTGTTIVAGAYGTLTIDALGEYSYQVDPTSSTAQALKVGQTLTETFTYTAQNAGGSEDANLTITINGVNDVAVVTGDDTAEVTEDLGNPPSDLGILIVNDADSGESSFLAGNYAGTYGTIALTTAGSYSYTLNNSDPLVQSLAAGVTATDTVAIQTFDGSTHNVTVTITGVNDPAVIGGDDQASVTEDGDPATLTDTGILTISDADAGQSEFAPATMAGIYGSLTLDAQGNWTYSADNTQTVIQQLGAASSLTESFTVSSVDGTTHDIDIVINGTNDVAIIGGVDTGSVKEEDDPAILTTSGALTISDIDLGEEIFSATTTPGLYGSVTIDAAGNWTYSADNTQLAIQSLGEGSSVVDTITIQSIDGTPHDIIITINGTNDAAQISVGALPTVTEDDDPVTLNGLGTINIVDVDTGESQFTPAVINGTYGVLTIDAAGNASYSTDNTQTVIQSLGAGHTLTDTITVSSVDGTTFDVGVVINGTNDAAIIGGVDTGDVTEDGGALQVTSGALTISDTDAGEELFTAGGASGTYGSLSIDANGNWTYTLNNAHADVQALALGATTTDTVQVTALDGTTHDIVVTITGTNDAAVIGGVDTGDVTEDGGALQVTSGTLTISDTDTGEELFNAGGASGTYGSLSIDANGNWTYTLNNAHADVQALALGATTTDTVQVTALDGTTHDIVVTITGTNDAAVIGGVDTGDVTEDDSSTLTDTGLLSIADVDTGEAVFTPETVAGVFGSLTITATGNWTYSADNTQTAIQSLGHGETATDTVQVTAIDGTTHDITITITGTNDAAVIGGVDTGDVTEDGGELQVTSGTLTISDTDAGEELFTAGGAEGNYGSLTIDAAGVWTYTLNNAHADVQALALGATTTDTVQVTAIDGTTHDIVVTITGTNDAAVIGGVDTGNVKEDGGALQVTSGTLTISDTDTGEQLFTAGGVSGTYGSLTINAAGAWTYTLNNAHADVQALALGATTTDTVQVTAIDGTTHDIVITISGINDAAVIGGDDQGLVTEDDDLSTLTDTGLLSIADLDAGQAVFTAETVAGAFGSLTIAATGNWTYSADNTQPAIQSLGQGETATDTIQVTAIDGTTHNIDIVITGVNDAPVTGVDDVGPITTNGIVILVSNILSNDTDAEGDILSLTEIDGTAIVPGGSVAARDGMVTMSLDGTTLTFMPNPGYAGPTSFNYTVTDGIDIGEGTVTTEVTAVAGDDTLVVSEDGFGTVNVLANDDVVPETVTGFVIISQPESGSLVINPDLSVTYTPDPDYNGPDQFEYQFTGMSAGLEFEFYGNDPYGHTVDNITYRSITATGVATEFNVGELAVEFSGSTFSYAFRYTGYVYIETPGLYSFTTTSQDGSSLSIDGNEIVDNDGEHPPQTESGQFNVVAPGYYPIEIRFFQHDGDDILAVTVSGPDTGNVEMNLFDTGLVGHSLRTDTATIDITVNPVNDAATIAGVTTGSLIEDETSPQLATSGSLTISDIDDPAEEAFVAGTFSGAVGEISIDAAGNWTYTALSDNATIQALGAGKTKTDTITVSSVDGTQKNITITITGTNDAAVIGGVDTGGVIEDGGAAAAVSGALTISDTDTGEELFNAGGAEGAYGSLTIDANGNWTYTLNNAHADVQALALGATTTDTVQVTALDGTTHDIVVTITGTNDAAVIGGVDTGDVTEDGGALQVTSGTLTISDTDTGEQLFTAGGAEGNYGSLTIDAAGVWTYTLNNAHADVQALALGATTTDTVQVTAIDGTPHDIIITINGTNDAAQISVGALPTVTEDDDPVTLNGLGTINIVDVDTGESQFTPAVINGTYGVLTIDAAGNASYSTDNTQTVIQSLGAGHTLTDTITVSSVDGTTFDVGVVINGTNDAAIIGGVDTGDVTEDGGALQVTSGALTISDTDAGEELFTAGGASGTYGSLSIDANGNWTYTLNNAHADVQALALGATTTDTVQVTALDGTTHDIVVTITGTNDAAVIGGVDTGDVTEDGGALQVTSGTLTISDTDTGEELFNAGGASGTYGSLSIDANGNWTYTLNNAHADVQALALGATTTDTVQVTALDGTTHDIVVTITGTNDAAVIGGVDTGDVTEDGGALQVTSGTLTISDTDTGEELFNAGGASGTYGSLSIDANGNWTYTLNNAHADVQALALGATTTDTVQVTALDGTTHDIVVTITGTNDAAVIGGVDTGDVTEDGGALQVTSGTLTISDTDTGEQLFTAGGASGTYGSLAIDAAGAWTYTLNNAHADVQALALGATTTDTVQVTAIDGTPHDIIITINGTNDAAQISVGALPTVTEDDDPVTLNGLGTINIVDVDTGESQFTPAVINGTYGVLTIDAAGNASYSTDNTQTVIQSLGAGHTLTDTITVSSVDGTTFDVGVVINGTNDAAIIGGVDTGDVTEDGGALQVTSGALTISDTDAGEELFTAGGASGTYGSLSIDANGNWTYTLNNAHADVQALALGATTTDTVQVTALDGTTHDIVVTITGTNDAAVIGGVDTGDVTEDGGALQVTSGTLTISDTDTGEELFTAGGASGTYGSLSIDANGNWTYTLNNAHADVQALALGATTTDTVQVTALDGTTHDIVVTITGTNDAAVIGGVDTGDVTEDGGALQVTSGTLTISDTDTGEELFNAGGASGTYGSLSIDANGNWTYTLNNAHADVQALALGATTTDTVQVTALDGTTHDIVVTITGTADSPLILQGDSNDNILFGADNNDIIDGLGGNDTIFGFGGNDILDGSEGNDTLSGGAGNDRIFYDAADDPAGVTGGLDTDTLVVVDGVLPVGYDLVAGSFEFAEHILNDTASQPWSTITRTYDDQWRLLEETTENDDGTKLQIDHDPDDLEVWSELRREFNAANNLTFQQTIYDNGSKLWLNYDPANLSPDWSEQRFEFDTNGDLTFQQTINDDGSKLWLNYDPDGLEAWSELRSEFNADSDLTFQQIVNDDGSKVWLNYDPDSVETWSELRREFNAGNALTFQQIVNDDETKVWINYDPDDIETWSELRREFDTGDNVTFQQMINDDGSMQWINFDVADQYGWNQHYRDFNAAGDLINEFFVITGTAQNDVLNGTAFSDRIDGLDGNDTVSGGDGADVIFGNGGSDTLSGGSGADIFNFVATDTGIDTITDFENDVDILNLQHFQFSSAQDVLDAASSNGADTVIDLGAGTSIVLQNFALANFNETDFLV